MENKEKSLSIDIKEIITIAQNAGAAILDVYNREEDFNVEYKADAEVKTKDGIDKTRMPLTEADMASHNLIESSLKKLTPEIPILSEESKEIPYEARKDWDLFWMVDPLDGTKEFIKRNGEFTVNIALIQNSKPILGVIYVPVQDVTYFAKKGNGSFKQSASSIPTKLPDAAVIQSKLKYTVVASKSHFNDETKAIVEELAAGRPYDLISAGSSLKFCLVAEGKADAYPRLWPTMEWDSAAAHAIVNEAGKKILQYGKDCELEYNKENLLNPSFIAI